MTGRRTNVVVVSPAPLYAQIKDSLRSGILDGSYAPHDQMPSESELMARFKVSRITVRQALGDLQKEGMLYKIRGKGTFVSKPKAFQDLARLQGFGEAMSRMGYETYNKLLSFRSVRATEEVCARLGLPARAPVTEIKRLRYLNREPISVDVTWLAADLGERLREADLATRDIFLILENDCRIALGHAELQIGALLADEALARQLRIEEGAPILKIDRLTFTAEGRPLDYEHLFYRGDAFQYRLRIERRLSAGQRG